MKLNHEQLLDYVADQDFTYCKLKDNGSQVAEFGLGENSSSEDLKDRLDDFGRKHPGFYYAEFRRTKHNRNDSSCKVYVTLGNAEISEGQYPATVQGHPGFGHLDEAETYFRERFQKEREFEDLKREREELQSLSGKLNFVLMEFIKGLMNNKVGKMSPIVQGVKSGQESMVLTDEDQNKIKEAVSIFLQHESPDFLLALARKVERDPGIIKVVKNFI